LGRVIRRHGSRNATTGAWKSGQAVVARVEVSASEAEWDVGGWMLSSVYGQFAVRGVRIKGLDDSKATKRRFGAPCRWTRRRLTGVALPRARVGVVAS
jgi:hypothetical protein